MYRPQRPGGPSPRPPLSQQPSTTYSQMYEQANHGQVVYQKGAGGMIYTQGPLPVRPPVGPGVQYRPMPPSAGMVMMRGPAPRPQYQFERPPQHLHSQQQQQPVRQQEQQQYFSNYSSSSNSSNPAANGRNNENEKK